MATKTTRPKQEGVELIASGYEWECPKCGTENTVIAIPAPGEAVRCSDCKKRYFVEFANHARER